MLMKLFLNKLILLGGMKWLSLHFIVALAPLGLDLVGPILHLRWPLKSAKIASPHVNIVNEAEQIADKFATTEVC